MFKKTKQPTITTTKDHDEVVLLCVDGQQRLTTTSLFLAALRVHCRKWNIMDLVDHIDSLLFKTMTDGSSGNDAGALDEKKNKIQQWAENQATQLLWQHQQQQESPSSTGDTPTTSNTSTLIMPSFPSGWLPPTFHTTLVPSYVDRAAYFEILLKDHVEEALERQQQQERIYTTAVISLGFSSHCQASIQHSAFHIFSQQLSKAVVACCKQGGAEEQRNNPHTNGADAVNHQISSLLSRLFRKQLYGFTFMYIELLTDDNLQQVFLWMQEKSLFGMGHLLFNPHPGVDFSPVDLARNLVVSSVMNEPLQDQVDFYQECWLTPLEERFSSSGMLGKILESLVERVQKEYPKTKDNGKKETRYIGDMEQQLEQYKAMVPPALRKNFQKDTPVMVYGRFHSYVQQRSIEIEGDPRAITRAVADSIVNELVQEGERLDGINRKS
jgi:hypothetical protein